MTIALIDDHSLFIQSLKILLAKNGYNDVSIYTEMKIFLEEEFLEIPDIVIVELMMEGINGIDFIEMCRNKFGDNKPKVIVLSTLSDMQLVKRAMRYGASSYLTKSISFDEFLEAINAVFNGKQFIATDLKESLLNSIFITEKVNFNLSPREKEVLNMVCRGNTIKQIAVELKLSIHTAQYYHRRVMSKFKVKRTADLIVVAMKNGFFVPDSKR
ncbi:response regulator transcription factor [Ferruginibacter sp. SUN106]|uniref:response regulator transcription factor n=1 Tax=Ferruginibacter sp. SUN106 TaxID=2978348 RepID=UPI003D362ACF